MKVSRTISIVEQIVAITAKVTDSKVKSKLKVKTVRMMTTNQAVVVLVKVLVETWSQAKKMVTTQLISKNL